MRASMRIAAVALLLLAAGCNGDDSSDTNPPPPPGPTDFDAFVIDLVQNQTAETNEPQPVNGVEFALDEDEHAFDALFQ